jgi:uncharacterized glyoxalase superfamily protein PhnB
MGECPFWCWGVNIVSSAVSLAVDDPAASSRFFTSHPTITVPLRREPWGELTMQLSDPNGVAIQLTEWIPPGTH